MIRIPYIVSALTPLVGWRQAYSPLEAIDEELTRSESGLYYQDAHPLLTLNNIKAIVPDSFTLRYPKWILSQPYKKGQKVWHGTCVWVALQDNLGMEPPANDFNGDFSNN